MPQRYIYPHVWFQVALDLLGTVVRASANPLSDEVMSTFLPTVHCVIKTDDNATMQSGGETLRAFASVAMDQIAAFRDEFGKTSSLT